MCVSYCTYTEFRHTTSYRTIQKPYNHMQNAHYGRIVHCVSYFRYINIFLVWIHNVFDSVYSVWNSYRIEMNEGKKSNEQIYFNHKPSSIHHQTNELINRTHCFFFRTELIVGFRRATVDKINCENTIQRYVYINIRFISDSMHTNTRRNTDPNAVGCCSVQIPWLLFVLLLLYF